LIVVGAAGCQNNGCRQNRENELLHICVLFKTP